VQAVFQNGAGQTLGTVNFNLSVTPFKPLVLDAATDLIPGITSVSLMLVDKSGKILGDLAKANLQMNEK
jgi:hypothetical protein